MAGLFAAVFLQRKGFRVDVYERAADLADRGAGIVTHDHLYDALRRAGVTLRPDMGIRSAGRMMLDAEGEVVGTYDMSQIMTSWGLIYRFLREQLPASCYHPGFALETIEMRSGGATAVFRNGERAEAEWLVAADGAQSTLRGLVAPEVGPQYCGYYIWRGLIDETRIPRRTLEELAGRLVFGMAPGGHWLGYLVAGPRDELAEGQRRYNWAWYRSGDDAVLRELLTDASGHHHAAGIPHDRIRAEHSAAMREEAGQLLAPQMRAVIAATPVPFLQPIYELGCERLVYGRVAVLGDAAFTARPHVGMGVSKAADDAFTLAAALAAADPETATTKWETDRLAYGRAVLQWGRDLGSYIGPPPRDDAHRAKAEYYQRPEVLMSVTAASDPSPYLSS